MANQRKGLTASNIKYLLAMYHLYTGNNTIRCVKIAEVLDITKPSVHTMLNTLKEMKLIKKDYRGEVFFTEEGLKLAEKYSGYYTVLGAWFEPVLCDSSDKRVAVCAILAEISLEHLQEICTKISEQEKSNVS